MTRTRGRRGPSAYPLTGAVAIYAALQVLGRRAGSSRAERRRSLPGDELVEHTTLVTNHAGTAWFEVAQVDAPHLLVLHSTTHVPARWRERWDVRFDWVWTFALDPHDDGTRLLIRNRGRISPWWLDLGYVALIVPADYVMAMSMLRGIKRRTEHGPGVITR